MIQHSGKKTVPHSTHSTEQVEILSTPIDRVNKDSALLKAEIARLHQHNQVLQNCWQSAKSDYSKSIQDLRACNDRVAELEKEVEELQAHLNPKEVAA